MMKKLVAAISTLALAAAGMSAATAQAEVQYQYSFGGNGGGAGQLGFPMGLGINNSSGHVYVGERNSARISEFTEGGQFVRAWGYNVIASGPHDKPNVNEVQQLTVPAQSGSFTLTYEEKETPNIPFNASPGEVEAALNALPTINAGGGSVTVTGGPGSASASTPYRVTFGGGPLAGQNVSSMSMRWSGLGQPVGTRLQCKGEQSFSFREPEFSVQWIANGVPIPGATGQEYTPTAADAGKAIQCEITGNYANRQRRTNPKFTVIHPAPSTPIPEPPSQLPFLSTNETMKVGGPGGQKIQCSAGSWTGNPTSYTYEWFRDNQPIGTPVTTPLATNEYTTTPEDVEKPSTFQCRVTATNAGGSAVMWTQDTNTEPAPESGFFEQATVKSRALPHGRVGTYVQGGPQLEVCEPSSTPPSDVCQAGEGGPGIGQLSEPAAIAVDNSPGGNGAVWVVERGNARAQKFSATGTPEVLIGFEVNESSSGNVCTVASGDACGDGPHFENFNANRNIEPGSFAGGWPESTFGTNPREVIDTDPAGNVYIGHSTAQGESHKTEYPRIQKFDSNGNFLSQVVLPTGIPGTGVEPLSVGITSKFDVVATTSTPEIEVFKQSDFTPDYTGPRFSERNAFATGASQTAMAIDPSNDYIWASHINVLNGFLPLHVCNEAGAVRHALIAWDVEGHKLECSAPTGPGELPSSESRGVEGLAVSPSGMLFAAVGTQNLVKAFKIPEATAPEVVRPSVRGITTETAKLGVHVKPGFLPTEITVEYGPQDCSSNPCTAASAGKVYGLLEQFAETTVQGLEPETRYHYRVIAKNSKGEDVGPDRTFTTHTFVDLNSDKCDNVLVRKQTRTGALLDCRAYELASAPFSGGYDVVSDLVKGGEPLDMHSGAPGKLLYTVDGGIPGTGNPTNLGQDPYVAVRGDSGWTTKYVGIPSNGGISQKRFASTALEADDPLSTFAFGGPDICEPCLADGSTGIPVRLPDGTLVQGMQGSIPQPNAKSSGYVGRYLSADGSHLVFGTTSQLESTDTDGGLTIYQRDLQGGTTQVVSTDPSGNPLAGAPVGELDQSSDGSRVLVGKEVKEDKANNVFWHLYMHIGSSSHSVDLTPGTTSGVLFDGMTADGSRVFFTTADGLDPQDSDEIDDIYEASVDSSGNLALRLVSVGSGGPSNDVTCTPAGLPNSWNSPTGDGKCGALAFAGGAGIAKQTGTFFFLSPEQLDGSQGTKNQANLYEVDPGGTPSFVATIDTSEGKPGPGHWTNELSDPDVTNSTLEQPKSLAVDQSNGDIYAMEAGSGNLARYDSTGAPKTFSATGTNKLPGLTTSPEQRSEVAIDNSGAGSATNGDIFASHFQNKVDIFDPNGNQVGELTSAGNFLGAFFQVCGVAVDQSNGDVYVADNGLGGAGILYRLKQKPGATAPFTDEDYEQTHGIILTGGYCSLAANDERVFAAGENNGPTKDFEGGSFGQAFFTLIEGVTVDQGGTAVSIDPVANELYVDNGTKINVYAAKAPYAKVNEISGGGLSASSGVAVNDTNHAVYASNGNKILEFGYVAPPYHPLSHPAIRHAEHSAVHRFGDFQVTPDGSYAAFTTAMPLKAGYDNAGMYEVYRYASSDGELTCTSCVPTEGQPSTDSVLPEHGSGLTDDGRLFFNTGEQLVLRDTNENLDAYEWSPQRNVVGGCAAAAGCQQLISSGTSIFDSGMLGVTSKGTDAFFFTREKLVDEDFNGEAMKIYDAREGGGFFKLPEEPPCAAADECRGAGSQAGPPPQIGTFKGTGGQAKQTAKKCRKGFHKKHRKCVKKRHTKKKRKKGSSRKGGNR
jgi:hypothetical protein